jgi:hypothetical protein
MDNSIAKKILLRTRLELRIPFYPDRDRSQLTLKGHPLPAFKCEGEH